jgi:hypothetical protein
MFLTNFDLEWIKSKDYGRLASPESLWAALENIDFSLEHYEIQKQAILVEDSLFFVFDPEFGMEYSQQTCVSNKFIFCIILFP